MLNKLSSTRVLTIFLCGALLFLFGCSTSKKIATQDEKALEELFKYLLYTEEFGYTLWGTKPISTCQIWIKSLGDPKYDLKLNSMFSRWKKWEKYLNRFKFRNYIFKSYNYDNEILEISLINRRQLLKCVTDNIDFFEDAYNCPISPASYVNCLLKQEDIFSYSLGCKNQAVMGILLGYDRKSCEIFNLERLGIPIDLNLRKGTWREDDKPPRTLYFPAYICFGEYKDFIKKKKLYEEERAIICSYFNRKDFLNFILESLSK